MPRNVSDALKAEDHWPLVLRRIVAVVTLLFGVIPATFLVIFAGVMAMAGITVWFQPLDVNVSRALLALPISAMAIAGYIALIAAAARPVTGRVAFGLGSGLVANAYAIYIVSVDFHRTALDDWYLYFPPFVVGCGHLLNYAMKRSRGRRSASTT